MPHFIFMILFNKKKGREDHNKARWGDLTIVLLHKTTGVTRQVYIILDNLVEWLQLYNEDKTTILVTMSVTVVFIITAPTSNQFSPNLCLELWPTCPIPRWSPFAFLVIDGNYYAVFECKKGNDRGMAYKSRANVGTSLGWLIIPSSMRAWCREASLSDQQFNLYGAQLNYWRLLTALPALVVACDVSVWVAIVVWVKPFLIMHYLTGGTSFDVFSTQILMNIRSWRKNVQVKSFWFAPLQFDLGQGFRHCDGYILHQSHSKFFVSCLAPGIQILVVLLRYKSFLSLGEED